MNGVAIALLVWSCSATTKIAMLDPRPDVRASQSLASAQLAIGNAVEDSFQVPTRGLAPTIRVREWRRTLARGFHNAVAAQVGGSSTGESSVTIRIERANLVLIAASLIDETRRKHVAQVAFAGDDNQLPLILAHGSHSPPTTAVPRTAEVYAEIAYSANLVDGGGRLIGRSSGSALSKMSTSRTVSVSEIIQSSVETMVEGVIASI